MTDKTNKLNDEKTNKTNGNERRDVYKLPTLEPRHGWDLVTLPVSGGDSYQWLVR